MLSAALLLATSLQAQTPAPAPKEPAREDKPTRAVVAQATAPATAPSADASAAERAAVAAERAAAAAERSAEASARLAEAMERLAEAAARNPGSATPPPPVETAKANEVTSPKSGQWDVSIGLGLISLTGNASTLTFSGLASAQRKTEHWIYSLKSYGAYGRSRPPEVQGGEVAESQVVALNAGLELRGDRRFTQLLSGYLLAGADTDHVKSVESRPFGEGGGSILWWDGKTADGRDSTLRTDIAFRYARETRFQYYPTRMDLPDVDLGGPRFGALLRYGLSQDIIFQEDVEVLLSVIGDSRVLLSSQTQLNAKLTQSLSLGVGFLVKSDSEPPAGKVSTDTALSFNLSVAL
ncbi:DUF481 domain-containing protein [Corallococcus sp. H22C18031201]|nr:DUF481 domain-containing protein [Corallococcus sp. H22C18031201]